MPQYDYTGVVKMRRTLITPAQIANMVAAPIVIVPGSAGQLIILDTIVLELIYGGTPYVATGAAFSFEFNIGGPAASTAPTAAFFTSTTNQVLISRPASIASYARTLLAGIPVSLLSTAINPTGGNSNVIATAYYKMLTL